MNIKILSYLILIFVSILPRSRHLIFNSMPLIIKESGKVTKKEIAVTSFTKIDVRNFAEVYICQTGNHSLTIEADDNYFEYIDIENKNNELMLGTKDNIFLNKPIKYYINVKDLNSLVLSGSVKAYFELLTGSELNFNASGSSKINGKIEANKLKLNLSGSAKTELEGKADFQELNCSGSVKYNGKNLQTKSTNVKASGAIYAELNSEEKISGNLSGASKIFYCYNPEIKIKSSGASKISKF